MTRCLRFMLGITMLSAPTFAAAQATGVPSVFTLTGVIKDSDGNPLKGAEIVVGGTIVLSDAKGEFTMNGVPTGTVELEIRRVGYQSVSKSLVTAPEAKTVSIAANLVRNGQVLGTIVIEGKSVDRGLIESGFYQRQRNANGVFFPPERMEHTAAALSTLMNEVATVRVARLKGNAAVPMAPYGYGVGGPIYCRLNIFLDGVYLPWATEAGLDAIVPQQDVKAIEVYTRGSSIPPQIKGSGSWKGVTARVTSKGEGFDSGFVECGAILLWTKSFGSEERAKSK